MMVATKTPASAQGNLALSFSPTTMTTNVPTAMTIDQVLT
jgi:hypothetical protein